MAKKLGVPASQPMPQSLMFLADPVAVQKSWEKFLSGTDAYRARLREWTKERKSKPELQRPGPASVEEELFAALFQFGSGGSEDHLSVKLSLPSPPTHSNGQWDDARRQVLWALALEEKEKTARLPVFCYASWSLPDGQFQQEHFGRVILAGDELLKYCLWHGGLTETQGSEWDKFLTGLRAGEELTAKLEAFQFAGDGQKQSGSITTGKDLLKTALQPKR